MSADLYLIALPSDQETLETYKRIAGASLIGDVDDEEDNILCDDGYWRPKSIMAGDPDQGTLDFWAGMTWDEVNRLREEIGVWNPETPNIWIGQVSWLKAGLDGDPRWIPSPVLAVDALYRDYPILTPGLAKATIVALNLPNQSHYGKTRYHLGGGRIKSYRARGITKRRPVKRWLEQNIGKRIVAESW